MKILIGGGSGFIGSAFAQLVKRNGCTPIIVGRTKRPNKMGVEFLTWDDIENLGGLPHDCDAVVNFAGSNILDPLRRFPKYKREVYDSRINSTKRLVELIESARVKPKVWVSSSAIGFYPTKATLEYDEYSESGDESDFLVKVVKDWEAAAKFKCEETNDAVRSAVIRTGVVLGRTGGMINNLFLPFYAGLGGPVGSGAQWLSWIHLNDITRLFLHAIQSSKATGILNGTSPHPVTNAEFSTAFGKALWRPAIIPVPATAMKLAYGPERAAIILEGSRILPTRTLESGFKFKYPTIDEACKEVARFAYTEDELLREIPPAPRRSDPKDLKEFSVKQQ